MNNQFTITSDLIQYVVDWYKTLNIVPFVVNRGNLVIFQSSLLNIQIEEDVPYEGLILNYTYDDGKIFVEDRKIGDKRDIKNAIYHLFMRFSPPPKFIY